MIIVHNHPSESLEASLEDYQVCSNLREAGQLLGIHLQDFIIIADVDDGFYSFHENGAL